MKNLLRLIALAIVSIAVIHPTNFSYAATNLTSPDTQTIGGIQSNGGMISNGSVAIKPLGTPTAPVITGSGTAGTTSYTYYCVGIDVAGNETINSSSKAFTTGNATLSTTNYNNVFCPGEAGAVAFRVLKADTTHSLGICETSSGSGCTVLDQSTSAGTAYTANTVDQTGSLTSALITAINVSAMKENTAGAQVTAGATANQTAFTVTGATANMGCECNLAALPPATWQTGIVLGCAMTTDTLTPYLSNGTAGNITPAATAIDCRVIP